MEGSAFYLQKAHGVALFEVKRPSKHTLHMHKVTPDSKTGIKVVYTYCSNNKKKLLKL